MDLPHNMIKDLLKRPGVNVLYSGTKVTRGQDTGTPCIKVGVTKKQFTPQPIPTEVLGQKTDVLEIPPFLVQSVHTEKHRPLIGGISCGILYPGNISFGSGTLGCLAKTRDKVVGITNTHVIGIVYDPEYLQPTNGFSEVSSLEVMQPSYQDGGSVSTDRAGVVYRAVPIRFGIDAPLNYTDAATLMFGGLNTSGLDILGQPAGPYKFGSAQLFDFVSKSGRTTGVTESVVIDTDASVFIDFALSGLDKDTAYFTNQIMTQGLAHVLPGDSGSALVRGTDILGLVFAATETGEFGLSNHISRVAELLDLEPWDGSIVVPLSNQETITYNGRTYIRKGVVRKPIQFEV